MYIYVHIDIFIYKESMHCEYLNHLYHSFLVASLVGEILPLQRNKKTSTNIGLLFPTQAQKGFKQKHQNSAKKSSANLRSKPDVMAWGQRVVIIVAILAISEAL